MKKHTAREGEGVYVAGKCTTYEPRQRNKYTQPLESLPANLRAHRQSEREDATRSLPRELTPKAMTTSRRATRSGREVLRLAAGSKSWFEPVTVLLVLGTSCMSYHRHSPCLYTTCAVPPLLTGPSSTGHLPDPHYIDRVMPFRIKPPRKGPHQPRCDIGLPFRCAEFAVSVHSVSVVTWRML